MDVPPDVTAWAERTLHAVHSGLHARVSGTDGKVPVPSDAREALMHVGVLLTEVDDLLAFEHAEHALREQDVEGNDAFNYALALDAVRSLQAQLRTVRGDVDPDVTIVEAEPLTCIADQAKDTVQALEDRHAQELAQVYAQHSDELEGVRAEQAEQEQDHHRVVKEMEQAHREALEALQARHAKHTADADRAHHEAVQSVCAERDAAWRGACDALERMLAHLQTRTVQNQDALRPLVARLSTLAEAVDSAAHDAAAARTDAAAWMAKHTRTEAELAETRTQLAARDADLVSRTRRLAVTEHKLQEMQREMESAVHTQANMDEMQARVTAAEAEAAQLREQLKALEPMRAERAQLSSDVHELQKLVSMYKDGVAHAQHEHEHTQQELDRAEAQRYALEQALQERDAQIASLRDAKRRTRASHGGSEQRISELECELSAKAAEIEDADTRLLAVMKENKRLATQLKSLRADSKRALQDVTNARRPFIHS